MHALKHGAASATFVDSSEPALELVSKNLELNEVDGERFAVDAVTFLKNAKEQGRSWDIISCDPPKFVRARNHRDDGLKKYARLNHLALSLLKPGGMLLTCSCSEHVNRDDFLRMLTEAAHRGTLQPARDTMPRSHQFLSPYYQRMPRSHQFLSPYYQRMATLSPPTSVISNLSPVGIFTSVSWCVNLDVSCVV